MRIAYQGEPGAYSEAAGLRFSGHAECCPVRASTRSSRPSKPTRPRTDPFPLRTPSAGASTRNYDPLLEHELPIVGEVQLQVSHNLLGYWDARLENIARIYSHPQGLAQCERFLQGLTGVEIVATYDTAGSAKMIREKELRDAGAIASARAAEVFGLAVLESNVQDFAENITRFLIIGRQPAAPETADKTTIVFTLPNAPGALFKALSVFALRDIDLTKLESRPVRGRAWEYLFYADMRCLDGPAGRARWCIWRNLRGRCARSARASGRSEAATRQYSPADINRETRRRRTTGWRHTYVHPPRSAPLRRGRLPARWWCGFTDEDLRRIRIANTGSIGRTFHLRRLAGFVKEGAARAHPHEFNTVSTSGRHHDGQRGMKTCWSAGI